MATNDDVINDVSDAYRNNPRASSRRPTAAAAAAAATATGDAMRRTAVGLARGRQPLRIPSGDRRISGRRPRRACSGRI